MWQTYDCDTLSPGGSRKGWQAGWEHSGANVGVRRSKWDHRDDCSSGRPRPTEPRHQADIQEELTSVRCERPLCKDGAALRSSRLQVKQSGPPGDLGEADGRLNTIGCHGGLLSWRSSSRHIAGSGLKIESGCLRPGLTLWCRTIGAALRETMRHGVTTARVWFGL